MKKIAALLYIFLLLFTSCEEEVDYDDLGVKNIIVLYGRFIDGETPWCQVSRSDIVFEQVKNKINPTTFLPDANVTVTEGNADYKYKVIGDSAKMEADGLKTEAGATYTLKVKADGLDDVYTTVTVPSKVKVDLKLVDVEKKNDDFYEDLYYIRDTIYKVNYELNIEDDPNTEDYYQIVFHQNIMHYEYEDIKDTIYGYWDGVWIEDGIPREVVIGHNIIDSTRAYEETTYFLASSDPVMNWNQPESSGFLEETEYNDNNLFNDQLFNGQTSKIKFCLYLMGNKFFYGGDKIDEYPVYYEVRHINKDMYMYHRTFQKVVDNDWTGSLSPYMLYCNVENGAGLVAAWSSVKKEIEFPKIR